MKNRELQYCRYARVYEAVGNEIYMKIWRRKGKSLIVLKTLYNITHEYEYVNIWDMGVCKEMCSNVKTYLIIYVHLAGVISFHWIGSVES